LKMEYFKYFFRNVFLLAVFAELFIYTLECSLADFLCMEGLELRVHIYPLVVLDFSWPPMHLFC
jgi:hypothetical protein